MQLMKHIVLCCLIFILTGTLASVSASDSGLRFGIRAGVNRNMFFIDREPDIEMGLDFGAGLAANIPLTSQLSLSPEVSLYFRESGVQIYYSSYINDFYNYYITEMVLSAPIMVQFMPVKDPPLYFTAGIQLDISFRNRLLVVTSERYVFRPIDNRSAVDFGIPLGVGAKMRNLGVDFRYTINLNKPFHNWESSLRSFGLGVSYFL